MKGERATSSVRREGSAADFLTPRLGGTLPKVAIVLGSGLRELGAAVDDPCKIPYSEIPEFPATSVAGHGAELIVGSLDGVPVVIQSGRFHLYEGHSPESVAFPVRTFAHLGVDTLIVTNAAGGIRPTFEPPLLMLIADHLNYMWSNPLHGPVLEGEERFPDMCEPYDPTLRELACNVALEHEIALEEGVYAGVHGPSYETPAEIRMLARLGADAVGMSTVPEVIAARARGLRVLGISTITNAAAGRSTKTLSHDEVLAAGERISDRLKALVRGVVKNL